MKLGASLPDDDAAHSHISATKNLDAKALGIGVATILNRTLTFFMCHVCNSSQKIFPYPGTGGKNPEILVNKIIGGLFFFASLFFVGNPQRRNFDSRGPVNPTGGGNKLDFSTFLVEFISQPFEVYL